MIFVTVGNHDQGFERLLKHIDFLAKKTKEKIIIQRGYTKYYPKNCESFDFAPSLDKYYKSARLIIAHAGIGTTLEAIKNFKKPIIVVPRQFKFNEHINDHQVGMARYFENKIGLKVIYNISDLNTNLINKYKKLIKYDSTNLKRLQDFIKLQIEKKSKAVKQL